MPLVLQNGWCICSKSKSFAVYATTPIEKQQWMDHITRAVQEHVREGYYCLSLLFYEAVETVVISSKNKDIEYIRGDHGS